MNVMNHDQKIYDKGKSSTGSLLAEFYSLNQNTPSAYLPPECHFSKSSKKYNRQQKKQSYRKGKNEMKGRL